MHGIASTNESIFIESSNTNTNAISGPNREIHLNPEDSINLMEVIGTHFVYRDTMTDNGSPVRVLIMCSEPHKNEAQSLCEEMKNRNPAFVMQEQREQRIQTPRGSLIITYTIPTYRDGICAYELKANVQNVQHGNVISNCFQFEQFEIKISVERIIAKKQLSPWNIPNTFGSFNIGSESAQITSKSSSELYYPGSNRRIHKRFNVRFQQNY